MVIIKTGFTRFTDTDLLNKAQTIIDAMTAAVADYPTPAPAIAVVQTAKDDFETAKADKGSPAKTALKNQKRAGLTALLNSLALYVQTKCGDDEAKALRSGYDTRNHPSPVGDLPAPENFKLRIGDNPGEMVASMNSYGRKANSYIYRFSQADGITDPETWESIPSSKTKLLITGLESGKKVNVQGAGVGASMHLVWSNTITRYVI